MQSLDNPATLPVRVFRWLVPAVAAVLCAAAAASYSNAYHGSLVYDDQGSVADNPSIRGLASSFHPPSGGWPVSGRPLFNFSLAINYAISGQQTWSYHVLTVLIHVAAGLVLFGIVRRTLIGGGLPVLRAALTAGAAALLWTVHPLQTESVTYISQRSEAMMGLFYLLTLYAFIRWVERGLPQAPSGVEGRARSTWPIASVVCCLCGMATKEVMVTAPVIVLLYDRVFIAGSWRALWTQRKSYYLTLASTWLLLGFLMAQGGSRGNTAGFETAIAWWAYAITQFRAVAHYLVLCVWPHPLLFSYGMTLGGPPLQLVWDALLVLALAGLSLYWAVRGSRLGFLGSWFFIILSPTSTLVPVSTELIAEHRVYLSLAAVIVLAVCGADEFLRRAARKFHLNSAAVTGAALAGVALVAGTAGAATRIRNRVYESPLALWENTVALSPADAGARNNFGNALAEIGHLPEALLQYQAALSLVPSYDQPHFNLGNTLVKLGRTSDAIPHFRAALAVKPSDASFRFALGSALQKTGHRAEAELEFKQALTGTTESPLVWYYLGNALLDEGHLPEAKTAYAAALRLRPDYIDALVDHAEILAQLNDLPAAIKEFETAVRLQPGASDIHNNLGGLLAESGRLTEARHQFEAALALKPDFRQARDNLERVKVLELTAPR